MITCCYFDYLLHGNSHSCFSYGTYETECVNKPSLDMNLISTLSQLVFILLFVSSFCNAKLFHNVSSKRLSKINNVAVVHVLQNIFCKNVILQLIILQEQTCLIQHQFMVMNNNNVAPTL